ncbi:MAG: 3'-5' exonuclease [Chloroflexi bacterium]|nr:3'-5' exonuclease [Chloroflexota bacterium]
MKFLAIDFETANYDEYSACALGLVSVQDLVITEETHWLIRPPDEYFLPRFIDLHGITWDKVKNVPTFDKYWPQLVTLIENADFLVAHNAPFDIGVMKACCQYYGLTSPEFKYHCTVDIARRHFNIYPTKLPDVCNRLQIPLAHHDPLSDARASATIMMKYYELLAKGKPHLGA